ncbi:hypothetical protein PF327_11275 [Sulfurovum sp. XTW-4]|uniref:ASCH domain-containing protein n=1 Tax=Sulfurovum xiamenensis TaxID=3019066 RepID=A0ABT7QUS5_9BACT|nr:hypothetical protein [Sulfurovum xiamenensis]MDM5264776.1 hypothetical protein [Sulfurovum xiamenensis]
MNKAELLQIAKPILFNTEMVRAILDERKTQTRRVVKNPAPYYKTKADQAIRIEKNDDWYKDRHYCIRDNSGGWMDLTKEDFIKHCKGYKKDDVLYVRETFCPAILNMGEENEEEIVIYKADDGREWVEPNDGFKTPWKPSIHMPKMFARIFLKVTNVRVERLQEIEDNTDNFQAEGYPDSYELKEAKRFYSNDMHGEVDYCDDCMEEWWTSLWNATTPDGYKWEDNPYVFVYEFERIEV